MKTVIVIKETKMEDKKYVIESIDMTGPKRDELTLADAVKKLNLELENNKTIFIDGKPLMKSLVTDTDVSSCKKTITVVNQLIGG